MNEREIARASEIIAGNCGPDTHCVLAQIDLEGYPTAATVTAAGSEGIRRLTFCTGLRSNKAIRARACDRASVCFDSEEYNITLVGRIAINTDIAAKRAAWYQGLENHFSGPDDPGMCVLEFTAESYNLLVDWSEARGRLD